ncbi:hypothetical protein [Nocardioides bruguierae]|uniref:Uncharacterized protein n=1 Tax=Nocardioides bruguierae TaxID=2945102 RepID=A0A9X2D4W8_9ACTN|nr:hypothetical protein [Nocardioides bruguierae]MCM0619115.1 hypothetical protein [Nocardioides bruguierae]
MTSTAPLSTARPVSTAALQQFQAAHRRTWDVRLVGESFPAVLDHLEARYAIGSDELGRVLIQHQPTGEVESFATRDLAVALDVLLTREIEAAQELDRQHAGAGAHRRFQVLSFSAA